MIDDVSQVGCAGCMRVSCMLIMIAPTRLVGWLSQVYKSVSVRGGKLVDGLHVYCLHSLQLATLCQMSSVRCVACVHVTRTQIWRVGLFNCLRGWLAGWLALCQVYKGVSVHSCKLVVLVARLQFAQPAPCN